MKINKYKPWSGLAATALTLGVVLAAFGGVINTTVTFDPEALRTDTVTAPDGNRYLRLSAPDCVCVGEPGEPSVPYRAVSLLVPTYSNNFSVTVGDIAVAESQTNTLPIYPVQESRPTNEDMSDADMFTATNPEAYSRTIDSSNACVGSERVINGDSHVVSVLVPYMAYSPETGVITPNRSVTVSLHYDECGPDGIGFIPMPGIRSELAYDVAGLVANPEALPRKAAAEESNDDPVRYYILTPESLKESIEDLACWKRQMGYDVKVTAIEDILADTSTQTVNGVTAVDPESHVRNWLIKEYNGSANTGNNGFYLLMIGTYRNSVVRKLMSEVNDRNFRNWQSKSFDHELFIPTDAYFSDLTENNFNLRLHPSGHYTDGTTHLGYNPLLPTGRLLAESSGQLANYFRKLVIYQVDPGIGDTSYLGKGILVKQYQMRNCESLFSEYPFIEDPKLLQDSCAEPNTFENNRPTGKEVIDAMKGYGLISMQGHGSPLTIRCGGSGEDWDKHRYIQSIESYGYEDHSHSHHEGGNAFDNLENFTKPAVFYTMSCTVMPFDNFGDDMNRNLLNLGQSFTMGGRYGGVAFIGNTREGWFSEYATHSTNNSIHIEKLFGNELSKGISIGLSWKNSGDFKNQNGSKLRHCLFTRNIIGDPSIKIWRGEPKSNDISVNISNGSINLAGNISNLNKIVVYNGVNVSKDILQDFGSQGAISLSSLSA